MYIDVLGNKGPKMIEERSRGLTKDVSKILFV